MNVIAVIVAYNPEVARLSALCAVLAKQVDGIVVVDNSEVRGGGLSLGPKVVVIELGENTGIARAQNVGIMHARENAADAIVFFDQDSMPDDSYIADLLAGTDAKVAWVRVPVCVDRWTKRELPCFRLNSLGLSTKVYAGGRSEPYKVHLAIASGTAVSVAALVRVGLLDEELFIDFVDFEWCMRCRVHAVSIWVVPRARLMHSIGERVERRIWARGSVHGLARTYYKVRNSFLLFRKPASPIMFSAQAVVLMLFHSLVGLAFLKEGRGPYVRVVWCGIRDGCAGVVGRRPASS